MTPQMFAKLRRNRLVKQQTLSGSRLTRDLSMTASELGVYALAALTGLRAAQRSTRAAS